MPGPVQPSSIRVYDDGVLVGVTTALNFAGDVSAVLVDGVVNVTVTGDGGAPVTTTFTAGEALLLGDVVCLVATGGVVLAYKAANTTTLRRAQGVATTAAAAGASVVCTTLGTATVRTAEALVVGDLAQVLYLSSTPGCATHTIPTASGASVVEVGVVLSEPGGGVGVVLFRPVFVAQLG